MHISHYIQKLIQSGSATQIRSHNVHWGKYWYNSPGFEHQGDLLWPDSTGKITKIKITKWDYYEV